MFVLTNTAGASAATPPASKTTMFVDASGVPSTKTSGGTVTPLLTGPAAAAAYQPLDSDLTGIAGLTYTADKSNYYTGSTWATYDLTAAGRALSGVAGTANTFPYFSSANVVTLGSVTATGLSVLSAASQAAARTAIQAVGTTGTETVAGIKTFTSEVRIQNVAPGFWLDESDGTNGFFAVVDGGTYQLQVRDANFGPYVRQMMQISATGGTFALGGTLVRPLADNAQAFGASNYRFTALWAVNGTVQTSDARLKTEPRQLREAEFKAASAIARLPAVWRWLSRVHGDENCEPEGREARKHFGPTVQAAIAVMEAHGLDPFAYSFICYDEWPAEEATYDEEGNELTPAREAGDRYSFRKEELLCFIVSALAAENDLQAAKVEALDARLAALEAKA